MRTALGTFGKSKGAVGGEDDESRRRVPSIVQDAERTVPRVFKILLTAAPSMALYGRPLSPVRVVRVIDCDGHKQLDGGTSSPSFPSALSHA